MPLYFFDTDDGDEKSRDHKGTNLPDREAARLHALSSVKLIAKSKNPDGVMRNFHVNVRNEVGTTIFTARLELIGRWLD